MIQPAVMQAIPISTKNRVNVECSVAMGMFRKVMSTYINAAPVTAAKSDSDIRLSMPVKTAVLYPI